MTPPESKPPKVFISYSHDSTQHKDRVLQLSDRLRVDGVDCHIDQYEVSPPQGWPRWMIEQIEEADFVLVVCTENYNRRFRGKETVGTGPGAKWEGATVTQELYEAESRNRKFLPVLFEGADAVHIPLILRSVTRYVLDREEGYEELYRHLTNQPRVERPVLGRLRSLPRIERRAQGASSRDEIMRLVIGARSERSGEESRRSLEAAIRLCEEWEKSGGGIGAAILKAQTLGELAVEESSPAARAERWRTTLRSLDVHRKESPGIELADAYSSLAVDCFQDMFSDMAPADRLRYLRSARDLIDGVFEKSGHGATRGLLLSRESSVLRHLSMLEIGEKERARRLGESVRCATRAVKESREAVTLLEEGLAEWAYARYESTDEKYASRLRNAEKSLISEQLDEFEPAQLARTRFYRLTFRPLDACERFPRSMQGARNVRRVLRESYIYAEAAIQLWYGGYPPDVTAEHIGEARSLLEAGIGAGYRNARLIVALAYLRAITEGAAAGATVLSDICGEKAGVAWDEALRLAASPDQTDLVNLGFALGLDQSSVWTRLGTFAWRFLGDEALAEVLYRAAVRLGPRDAIALTNLARFVVRKGGDEALREGRRLLQKASSSADRRFTWWRSVLSDVEGKEKKRVHVGKAARVRDESMRVVPTFDELRQVRGRFRSLERLAANQERGYELERLVYEVAKLTFGTAAPPYRIQRSAGGMSQVDGYFEHNMEKYRVECKWKSERASASEIVEFADKLDVVGVSGVFISMNGFEEGAISRARELRGTKVVLLMNGDEVRAVLNGRINFDEVMRLKRLYFDQRSEAYHRVVLVAGGGGEGGGFGS